VEESFLALKSNRFNLEASRLRDKFALSQLCGVIALTMLFLVLQGVQVVASGKRRQVDAHSNRRMSYLKLGWNSIRLAITPFPSERQLDHALKREFTVLSRIPAS
jgi:hypothetical protein